MLRAKQLIIPTANKVTVRFVKVTTTEVSFLAFRRKPPKPSSLDGALAWREPRFRRPATPEGADLPCRSPVPLMWAHHIFRRGPQRWGCVFR